MDKLEVRQAISHAINREELVDSFYGGRGVVATQFMPQEIVGWADDVQIYEYNPQKARQLLQQAGLTLPVEIEFWYPTDVSRDYMPDPKRNFEAMAADLNAAGFKVTAKTAPWRPDYVSRVNAGNAGHLNLIGWIADFADADNFIGTFFQAPTDQWGFDNPEIHDLLDRGRGGVGSGQAGGALPGGQPQDHGLRRRGPLRARQASALALRQRHRGLRSEPGRSRRRVLRHCGDW